MVGRRARLAAALAVTIAVGACQTTPPPSGAPPASTGTAPSEAPSVAPSPSPIADVAPAFKAAWAKVTSGQMTLAGQATVGPVQLTIAGTTTFDGLDSSDTTTTTVSGVASETDHVATGGKRYVKKGTGPWLEDTSTAPANTLSHELGRVAALVTDSGLDSHNGTPAHKLVLPPGTAFDASTLGLASSGATDVQVTVTFYAKDDGTPVAVTLDATWSQPSGSSSVPVHMTLDIALSQLGVHHVIRVPDHVWVAYKSKRYGLRIAHPDDFDFSKGKFSDLFYGPNGEAIGVSRGSTGGFSLNVLTSGEVTFLKKDFHTKTVKNEDATLAGVKARMLSLTGTDSQKQKVVVWEVIAVKGAYFYDVFWLSYTGNEAADKATFQQVLSTFSFS
jgi:hypothetical protein